MAELPDLSGRRGVGIGKIPNSLTLARGSRFAERPGKIAVRGRIGEDGRAEFAVRPVRNSAIALEKPWCFVVLGHDGARPEEGRWLPSVIRQNRLQHQPKFARTFSGAD